MATNEVKKELMDLLDGRRKFEYTGTDGAVKEYFIGTPSASDVSAADWEHAKRYNQALKEGIFTVAEMMEILEIRNIIGPEYDKTGEELRVQLSERLVEMERETDTEKRREFALEVATLREEVFQWNQRLSSPLASTCENMANDARVEHLTSSVVQDVSGNRVWKSFDEYKTERNLSLQTKARFEVMLWLEGVDSDFWDKAPENVVLKEMVEAEKLKDSAPSEEMLKKAEEAELKEAELKEAELGAEPSAEEVPPVSEKTPKKKGRKSKK